jgi:prophage antirepressor-like protein
MTDSPHGAQALSFQSFQFDVVTRDGQPWLRLPQIAGALGYRYSGKGLSTLFERIRQEFTDSMTAVVKLPTAGGLQDVRIFSLRGAHLLGMFARTARAAEFRRWVLDILDQSLPAQGAPTTHPDLPAPAEPLLAKQLEHVTAERDVLREWLKRTFATANPRHVKLLRYLQIEGLNDTERALLMGWKGSSTFRLREMRAELAALGLVAPAPQITVREAQSAGAKLVAQRIKSGEIKIRRAGASPEQLAKVRDVRLSRIRAAKAAKEGGAQ